MKTLKVFVVFLISFPSMLFACASFDYGTYYIERGYNILHKDLVGNKFRRVTNSQFIPFYNEQSYGQAEITRLVNTKEWETYLNNPAINVDQVVYQGNPTDDLSEEMQRYLAFVRQVEPLVDFDNSWGRSEQPDLINKYNAGIERAEAELKSENSDFLKLRYLFGAMRLAHYSKQYDKELALYNTYYDALKDVDSEVQYWIAALKAGVDKKQGRNAEAAYQFAKVFQESRTKRYSAYVDFAIKTDAEWQQLISLAKDDNEKALMHFIRALKPKANSLQELKQIYALAPNSVWVDALLLRELEYVQFAKQVKKKGAGPWYPYALDVNKVMLIDDADQASSNDKQKITDQKITRRTQYVNELKTIVQQIRSEKKHKDLFLADFADVYLKLLTDEPVAMRDVGQLQLRYADDPRVEYLTPLKLFVYLENLPTVNDYIESQVSIYLQKIETQIEGGINPQDILAYTYVKLDPHYQANNAKYKAFIAEYRGVFDPDLIKVFQIRDLKDLQNKPEHNFLEKQMLASANEYFQTDRRPDEIIAKKYLSAGLFDKANDIVKMLPPQNQTQYNPFNNTLGGNNRNNFSPMTTQSIAEKLASISKEVEANPNDANAHYLLGNAHYNMSWFGNSPLLTRYYRSTSNWQTGDTDLTKAKTHYKTALKHAQDDELKAKIQYALAKIEFNEQYMDYEKSGANFYYYSFSDNDRRASVAKLKARGLGEQYAKFDQYKDTAYYQDVIQQCAIYRSWRQ